MKKIIFLFGLIAIITSLSAVHNFTVNGADSLQVAIGDLLNFDFDFEDVGNSATMEIIIYVSTFDFPTIKPENAKLVDGGSLDKTGVDGHFSYDFDNFFVLPQTSYILIKLTDSAITDTVKLTFTQLNSNFSISGKVLKEGEHLTTVVRGAFVYSFYNADKEELYSLLEQPSSQDFMDYMQENRYFISVLSNNSGDYQIFLPDDIPNVPCTVDAISVLDTNKEKVSPETQELTVNGNLTDINLLYQNPDGHYKATIINQAGDSLSNCTIRINNSSQTKSVITFSDSLGNCDIPLLNDNYTIKISKIGYQEYNSNFTINDADYTEIVVLSDEITHLDSPENVRCHTVSDTIKIFWNNVLNADSYTIYSSQNPYLPFALWNIEEENITTTHWIANISENIKFYKIVAKRNQK